VNKKLAGLPRNRGSIHRRTR